MITKFKIFENNVAEDESDLAYQFSDSFVLDYYKSKNNITIKEIQDFIDIWKCITDEDDVKKYFIEEIIKNKKYNLNDFTEDDLISYIEEENIEHKKNLNKDDLISILKKADKIDDFISYYYDNKWYDYSPKEVFTEIYDNVDEMYPYSYIKNFIDEEYAYYLYYNSIDFEYLFDYLKNYIIEDTILQKKLLEIDDSNSIALLNVMDNDEELNNIGNEYDFQKKYIESFCKINNSQECKELALKNISKKYEINKDIKKEYHKYLYLIDADKYNL